MERFLSVLIAGPNWDTAVKYVILDLIDYIGACPALFIILWLFGPKRLEQAVAFLS
jgi:hypothetical protein